MKLIGQKVSFDKLAAAMDCMNADLTKACKLVEVTPTTCETDGEKGLTYGDGFRAFAGAYLKENLILSNKQVRELMEKHDITFKNTAQIVRLTNAKFLSVKLRLHDLRREFLNCVEN